MRTPTRILLIAVAMLFIVATLVEASLHVAYPQPEKYVDDYNAIEAYCGIRGDFPPGMCSVSTLCRRSFSDWGLTKCGFRGGGTRHMQRDPSLTPAEEVFYGMWDITTGGRYLVRLTALAGHRAHLLRTWTSEGPAGENLYRNIEETGTWSVNAQNNLVVELTGDASGAYAAARVLEFGLRDGALVPIRYDAGEYSFESVPYDWQR